MNIAFYADHPYWGQLSNNGGTRTVLKSAATLRELGHEVSIVAHKDKFTWFKHHKPVHSIPANADHIIAVSISDLKQLLRTYRGHARLGYWARPYETWQMPMEKVLKWIRALQKRNGVLMCNSSWQVEELAKNGIKARVMFAGLDEDWHAGDNRVINRIGCLCSKRASKRWDSFIRLHKMLGPTFEFVAFGSIACNDAFLSQYLQNPSHEDLERLYQSCAFFFCPNVREGFYNCGYEAALCGCLLLVSSYAENGMSDYATPTTAHIFGSLEDAVAEIANADFEKIPQMNRALAAIGNRRTNMKRMVETLNESN